MEAAADITRVSTVHPPLLLYLVASLREVVQVLLVFRVDHVPDVSEHFSEDQGLNDVVHRV
jgi:hypothetical protein